MMASNWYLDDTLWFVLDKHLVVPLMCPRCIVQSRLHFIVSQNVCGAGFFFSCLVSLNEILWCYQLKPYLCNTVYYTYSLLYLQFRSMGQLYVP